MGLSNTKILTGPNLRQLSDGALLKRVVDVDVFAEIEPNQKERIIVALKKAGNVVGYMGDGVNDASALHAADVGISVESAVDVAKEAADIVLLEKDLGVLVQGVREGRTTFANTLKLSSWPLAPISATCSVWPECRSSCRFCHCAQADFAHQP
jgi:Mg2+-importing ATPase